MFIKALGRQSSVCKVGNAPPDCERRDFAPFVFENGEGCLMKAPERRRVRRTTERARVGGNTLSRTARREVERAPVATRLATQRLARDTPRPWHAGVRKTL